jgi:hypothetical protein
VTVTVDGADNEGEAVTVTVALPLCVAELVILVDPAFAAQIADVFIGTNADPFAAALSIGTAGCAWVADGSPKVEEHVVEVPFSNRGFNIAASRAASRAAEFTDCC